MESIASALGTSNAASACVAACALFLVWKWGRVSSSTNIPGPGWRLPIIGHLHLLGSKPHMALTEMQRKYGDVFRIQLGPHNALIISGKDVIKDSCALSSLAGRPHKFFNSWSKHDRYFAFGHSDACLQYRKAVMKALSSFTKTKLQEAVSDVVDDLVASLCETCDGQQQSEAIRSCVADISYFMCFGQTRRSRDNEEFLKLMSSLKHILSFARTAGLADLFPWALYLPPVYRKYQLYLEGQNRLQALVRHQETRHKLNIANDCGTQGSVDRGDLFGLLDSRLSEGELKKLRSTDSNIGTLTEQTGMLLVAGYETVAVSLIWAIIMLASHPAVQQEICEEIFKSDGFELLDAFLLETYRFSMASPTAMPHMTVQDTTINGYHVPKDTLVLVNLWSGSRDQRAWGDNADQFDPYRFIDPATGQVSALRSDQLIAFGSGRRRCAGEKLAKTEIRQVLIELLRRCQISLADDQVIDYWPQTGSSRNIPPTVNMRFTARQPASAEQ